MIINTRYELVKLINEKKLKTGVEVGVREGFYSYYLLKHSKLKTLYSVDPWSDRHGEQNFQNATSLMKHYDKRSVLLRETSMDAVKRFENGSLDFVYIDANHKYRFVKDDITYWWPKIAPGGILSGHDYIQTKGCGVIPAVTEFLQTHGPLKLNVTDEHLATWYVEKPE